MLRSQAVDYGYELNEFDPYFNYRATNFLVNNGLEEYLDWHDYQSWYPKGRNISATSQNMLHYTAALTYSIFGGNSDLYDFVIIFPVIFGSLTAIIIFALVRLFAGTSAGLFAALMYAVSVPVIVRGTIGWFKSEPLGLFYGLLGVYLFLSAIKSKNHKIALAKIIGAGIVFSFGLASWGGIQYFVLPLGIFFLALPFLRDDHKFQLLTIPIFCISFLASGLLFERPGLSFIIGLGGIAIIGPTLFVIACNILQIFSPKEKKIRNSTILLIAIIVGGGSLVATIFAFDVINLPSFRYLNSINPFLTTTIPLVDSVAEHATTTLTQSFYFNSTFMIFAGIGIWLVLRGKKHEFLTTNKDLLVFALILGITGAHISSSFVRLEIFASIATIIFASIGAAVLSSYVLDSKKYKLANFASKKRFTYQILFLSTIVILLSSPLFVPAQGNWTHAVKAPFTIQNGGTSFPIITDDWHAAFEWVKSETPEDSVIAAWWDYGYWITTLTNRTSLADNGTFDHTQIRKIAETFLMTPDEAWTSLQRFDTDYVLIFVAATQVTADYTEPLYQLRGGGDESKKQWFIRISEQPISTYLESDGLSGTPHFWENTLFGRLVPFSLLSYYDPATNLPSDIYVEDYEPIYTKNIKFPKDSNDPFRLAYASPSYNSSSSLIVGVIIYEVNKDYIPISERTS